MGRGQRYYDDNDIGIKLTKDELIERLTAAIPTCVARDRTVDADHKADERANWKAWQAACRAWGKRESTRSLESYKRLGYGPSTPTFTRVQCPTALAPTARRLLGEVKLSNQTTYTITSSNTYWRIHEILTMELPKPKSVC